MEARRSGTDIRVWQERKAYFREQQDSKDQSIGKDKATGRLK